MKPLLRGVFYGLLFETVAVTVLWVAIRLQGTRWAAVFGLALVLLLVAAVPDVRGRRWRRY